LTQSAFYGFAVRELGIGLGTYHVLLNVMNLAMIPASALAGMISDRRGNKWLLFCAVLLASSGLLFWFAATPEQWWWLFGAYALWGAFAAANIAGPNLLLKLSPRSDNSAQLALFRQIGGLVAGVSGLFGGLWLQSLLDVSFEARYGGFRIDAYRVLFLVSLGGRWASVLWILPIREHGDSRASDRAANARQADT
jgi:MFS family permease